MKRRFWTPVEVEILVCAYPDVRTQLIADQMGRDIRAVYAKAAELGLKKSEAFMASDQAGRIQRGRTDPRMVSTQFKKGQKSWNKGTHYAPGGRSVETRFKKGQRSKRWDIEAYALGALRVTTDGTLLIKARPEDGRESWQIMARYVWEQAHGPIPHAHVVRAKNGESHDTRLDNLELLTRSDNAKRNSVWTRYPREVAALVQLKGAITRVVNRIAREEATT